MTRLKDWNWLDGLDGLDMLNGRLDNYWGRLLDDYWGRRQRSWLWLWLLHLLQVQID